MGALRVHSAFVLGAGLGTRLKTLTQHRPKPLIPVANKPLITFAFDHLRGAGVERFVVNTHWRAEAYAAVFPSGQYQGAPLHFRHEFPEVLETGGGIKNIEDLVGAAPFFVYNGDILTDLPLDRALEAHAAQGNEVTLVLRSSGGPLQVALDPDAGRVTDIGRRLHPAGPADFLFTGVYLVNPGFLARIPPGEKISVIAIFLEMIRAGAKLGGVVVDEGQWWDLGTREQYLAVHSALHQKQQGAGPWIDPGAQVAPGALVEGASAVGAAVRIGEGAVIRDSILWEGAQIAPGSVLERCVVTAGAHVAGSFRDADL